MFVSSTTACDGKYSFNILACSISLSALMLLWRRDGILVESLHKFKMCFDVFQNVFELQSPEDKSFSRLCDMIALIFSTH